MSPISRFTDQKYNKVMRAKEKLIDCWRFYVRVAKAIFKDKSVFLTILSG